MSHFGEVRVVGFHPKGVECVRFGWGKIFSSGLDETIQSWDPSDGKAWNTMRTPTALQTLAANGKMISNLHALTLEILEDKGQIACGLRGGPVTILDATNGQLLRSLEFDPEPFAKGTGFCSLAISADEKWLAGTNRTYAAVWSLESGTMTWRSLKRQGGNSLFFCAGGESLMVQAWVPDLMMTEWRTEAPLKSTYFANLWGNMVTARPAPQGAKIDAVVSMLDLAEAPEKTEAEVPNQELEVDMDGTWDGREEKTRDGVEPVIETGYILGLDIRTHEVIWQVQTPGRIHDMCFLPDGMHLLTAGSSGRVELWQIGSGACLGTLDVARSPVLKNSGAGARTDGMMSTVPWLEEDFYPPHAVHSMALSKDGKQLALGTAGGAVLVTSIEEISAP